MTKRRRLLLGTCLVGTLAGVGIFVLWLVSPKAQVNEKGFKTIRPGMTQPEVEANLGVPPGDYSNGAISIAIMNGGAGHSFPIDDALNSAPLEDGSYNKVWIGDVEALQVSFDSGGKVVNTEIYGVMYPWAEKTFLEKLRRWLGL